MVPWRKIKRSCTGLAIFIFCSYLWKIIVLQEAREPRNLFVDITPLYYEPEAKNDFPTETGRSPKIPHILHQTYKTEQVPKSSIPFIQSFVKYNQNWTYFFWTDKTARKFLEDKFDFFLPIWDGYKQNVYRADALRYFVLYEYGGVYVDIDFECLRPLDPVTIKYPAIFPLEPFEHSVFRLSYPYLLNNAIMMSRPKHPFLEKMMHKLGKYVNGTWLIDVAGPVFVNNMYIEYNGIETNEVKTLIYDENSTSEEPYFFKGTPLTNKDDMVYVPNTHYFMNTLADNFDLEGHKKLCKMWLQGGHLHCPKRNNKGRGCRFPNEMEKRACNELHRRENRTLEEHFRYTFTQHHWFSTYFQTKIQLNATADIRSIVPQVHMYA